MKIDSPTFRRRWFWGCLILCAMGFAIAGCAATHQPEHRGIIGGAFHSIGAFLFGSSNAGSTSSGVDLNDTARKFYVVVVAAIGVLGGLYLAEHFGLAAGVIGGALLAGVSAEVIAALDAAIQSLISFIIGIALIFALVGAAWLVIQRFRLGSWAAALTGPKAALTKELAALREFKASAQESVSPV